MDSIIYYSFLNRSIAGVPRCWFLHRINSIHIPQGLPLGLKRYFPAENITRWILIRHGYKVWPLLVVGCNIHNDKWTDFCRVHRLRVGLCFFACERHWIFNTFMFNENGHECVTLGRIQLNPYSNCMISQHGSIGKFLCEYTTETSVHLVPISELEGNTIGLYFAESSYRKCVKFTSKLIEVYDKLKANGEKFEVVMIPLDNKEESFKEGLKSCLGYHFPSTTRVVSSWLVTLRFQLYLHWLLSDQMGRLFSLMSLKPLKIMALRRTHLHRKSFLSLRRKIRQNGMHKHWSLSWFREISILLLEKMNSSDRDQTSFEEYFSQMPWLALPFGDERKDYLDRIFKVRGIPTLVAIGPTGRTVTTEARGLVMCHGADAYPFTEARLKEIEAKEEEMAKGWPKKVKHELHEHELELIRRRNYACDGCKEGGTIWSFYCKECDFDLHPMCALEENKATKGDSEDASEEGVTTKEGQVCDGDVCHKA